MFALATDDSHHPGYDSGLAWTMVRAPDRSRESVLDALRSGSFYGSTGPSIGSVALADGHVTVECSAAASVTLGSSRARGARANSGRLGLERLSGARPMPFASGNKRSNDSGLAPACIKK